MKLSFKDTFYLTDVLLKPIKFLHQDASQNVAGAFIQIQSAGSGGVASHYYDVPELANMEESDSVSVIMIGINPSALTPPQTGTIKITPYDESGQPLTTITRPLKVTETKVDDPSGSGCGLVLPSGEVWEWLLTYIPQGITITGDSLLHFNNPSVVHSPGGQDIKGSCCNGISTYPQRCPGDTLDLFAKTLHFATYYQINFENFQFFSNGTFFRQTMEDAPLPAPSQSNFCGCGPGVVLENLNHTEYDGNWTILPITIPPDPQNIAFRSDSLQLRLQGTSSTGTGFGNPGGVIHELDCRRGSLVLIQLDREGGGKHLIKLYQRRKVGEPLWF